MAALGLTFGEIGLGTTKYGSLRALELPNAEAWQMVHEVSGSTMFPTKDLGHKSAVVSGVLLITAASVAAFVADVRATTTAERRLSFMVGAEECYVYVYAGSIASPACVNPYGTGTRQYEISWSFRTSRSKVYKASDDSVLWES